ncbi:DUF5683 domain-containing protein [Roseivirga misakiensis]|uniref:DUF5683 domain-containing protein n=1 Tax=Roseivirga misakiensis TaxID=1563681 RepID=A0A1E5T1D7_9BACT|nr:DUF5683 domain-containing protein [Roseivirga misakiensis]OEK05184.1 hypothetical protein BFP71_17395 [Roseivirga misakiensis]
MRLATTVLILVFITNFAVSQEKTAELKNGQIVGEAIAVSQGQKYYNPRKASTRSAIIPGWGQIYNDSWWKVPIIYGGLGGLIHFVGVNEGLRNDNLTKIEIEEAKDDPNLDLIRVYQRRADNWRKNRDLVFLSMAGLYALQIIDAAVDAHLKGFNVDEKLALNVKPKMGVLSNGAPYMGFRVTLPIGR